MNSERDWRDAFVLEGAMRERGARAQLQRLSRAGELTRVSRGVYRHRDPDPEPTSRARAADLAYLHRVQAAQLSAGAAMVFSHHSAAALWSLPAIEPWPERVHVVTGVTPGGRSTTELVRHGVAVGGAVERTGLLATTLSRTVIDVARVSTFREAVTMADAALRGLRGADGRVIRDPMSKDELFAELERAGRGRGVAQARRVVEFADAASGSPGESCSRVGFLLLGLPIPVLQQPFYDARGKIGEVDFWWPEFNLIGEFDGAVKYERAEFLRGRTPAEALRDEKRREDRLRALGPGVTRWDWGIALSLPRLRAHLAAAGLR